MRFFTYVAMAATATASFTQAEKEELFEVWTAQAEAGEISEDTYYMLAQALDGDAPAEFYAETESMADEIEIPTEFLEIDSQDAKADAALKKALGMMKKGQDPTGGAGNKAAKKDPATAAAVAAPHDKAAAKKK